MTTELAARSKKTKGVDAALEEGAEFLLDVRGKTSLVLLARFGEEGFKMLSHELVENRLGGAMLGVFSGPSGATWHPRVWARAMPSEIGPISSVLGVAAAVAGGGLTSGQPRRRAADERRDRKLARFGYRVLHIDARLIEQHIEIAVACIRAALAASR